MIRIAITAALAAGCATMFTGTKDTLTFDANVPGVHLSIDGYPEGELPLTLDMSRNFFGGKQFLARFEKPGYATQEFQLQREFNPVSILDISSPLTSGGLDVLTGSIMRFDRKQYHVEMIPVGQTASQRRLDVIRFALSNYRRIQTDIARGGGEYLESFTALAGPPQPQALAKALATTDAHDFARALGLFY